MIHNVNTSHVKVASAATAVTYIVVKWLLGTLVQKLIVLSTGADFQVSRSALYKFVLLQDLSFQQNAILAVIAVITTSTCSAAMQSLALLVSAETGRKLRSQILQSSVSASTAGSSSSTGMNQHAANELIYKARVIENFQAYDEHWILMNALVLVLSFILSFVFTWYGTLVAMALFACSSGSSFILERYRVPLRKSIDDNAQRVNARLLDVIKNGDRIKIMGMAPTEATDLKVLEQESDDTRIKDAKLKFEILLVRLSFLALVAIGMPLIAWPIITTMDQAKAIDQGFGILLAVLLADEGHKALQHIGFVYDKKDARDKAQAAINTFLGVNETEQPDEEDSTGTNADENGNDLDDDEENEDKIVKMELGRSSSKFLKKRDSIVSFHSVVKESAEYSELAVEDLTLAYPGRAAPVFLNHYQAFKRGGTHALVGESGCGKSTLLKVLAGLLKPTDGCTRIWQDARLAYVSQDQKVFARSIRENVSYGSTAEKVSDEEVWDALEWANIRPWIETLPNGIHEVLEGAESDISGGQLQRLLLAQLYCTCQNADVIMLDEVLSAVDPNSRQVLIDRLGEFLHDKTALVVTHNTEMLRICSKTHEMTKSLTKKYQKSSSLKLRAFDEDVTAEASIGSSSDEENWT